MKNLAAVATATGGFLFLLAGTLSCSKNTETPSLPNNQVIVGKWNINRMQLKVYYGGVFAYDTIIPQTPKPENFVRFDATRNFEYRFNTSTSDTGTYQLIGADSIISTSASRTYRWKILTLYSYLFTMMNTSTSPDYPGAMVETYYTLVH